MLKVFSFLFMLRWDVANNTWSLSEALRPLVLNFHFQRGGKTAYVITGFTGFVGAITGMKPVSKYLPSFESNIEIHGV